MWAQERAKRAGFRPGAPGTGGRTCYRAGCRRWAGGSCAHPGCQSLRHHGAPCVSRGFEKPRMQLYIATLSLRPFGPFLLRSPPSRGAARSAQVTKCEEAATQSVAATASQ